MATLISVISAMSGVSNAKTSKNQNKTDKQLDMKGATRAIKVFNSL
jgi:hypothetical protein